MIRLVNQNIAELEGLPLYVESIKNSAQAVLSDGTTLDVWGMQPGTYAGRAPIESLGSPFGHFLATIQMVQGAVRAEKEGYDAVIFSCFFDPGVAEARSAVSIPVIAITETALMTAFTLGSAVGMVGMNGSSTQYVREIVHKYGFGDRVVDIMPLDRPVEDEAEMDGSFGELNETAESFLRVARDMIARGADVIIPAEGVLSRMLKNQGVTDVDGVPVIDGFTNALLYAEFMVKFFRATGIRRDRTVFPQLSEAQSEAMRAAAKAVL